MIFGITVVRFGCFKRLFCFGLMLVITQGNSNLIQMICLFLTLKIVILKTHQVQYILLGIIDNISMIFVVRPRVITSIDR